MENLFKEATSFFSKNDICKIKELTFNFAKKVTRLILKNDMKALETMTTISADIREEIEFDESIKRDKSFYYGFWLAYEKIGKSYLEDSKTISDLEMVVSNEEKLRDIMKYLGKKNYAKQGEIAEHLKISQNALWNFLNKPSVKELNIFSVTKIGKYVMYSLNKKGMDFYNKNISNDLKLYSKNEIMELFDIALQCAKSNSLEGIKKKSKLLDEEMTEGIYRKIYNDHQLGNNESYSKDKSNIKFKKNKINRKNVDFNNADGKLYCIDEYNEAV